jgi:hypothetical protein
MKLSPSGARCGALSVNSGTGMCHRCELVVVMKSQRRKYEQERRISGTRGLG